MRISNCEFLSYQQFAIRISKFAIKQHEFNYQRHSLCTSWVVEEPALYSHRRRDTGSRHWWQYFDLHGRRRCVAARAAIQRLRAPVSHVGENSAGKVFKTRILLS